MARSDRQDDGNRGAVGTMARQNRRARRDQAPDVVLSVVPDNAERPARAPRRVPSQRPVTGSQPVAPASGQRAQAPGRRRPATAPSPEASAAPDAATRATAPRTTAPRTTATRATTPKTTAAGTSAPARPARRPSGAPWRVSPGGRPARPRPTGDQAVLTPAPATPGLTGPRAPQAEPGEQAAAATRLGSNRMPFVLLLCGLLGGALISALVISTTLAEGSFRISKLQDSTSALIRERQALQEHVAVQSAPETIAKEATSLGLRRPDQLQFLDLTAGKTTTDGPLISANAGAPGIAP